VQAAHALAHRLGLALGQRKGLQPDGAGEEFGHHRQIIASRTRKRAG
jgi:hypothetical protein